MAKHEPQGSQFSFQTFFQEAQKDLPFHQKPEPHVNSLRVEREDEPERGGGEAKRDDDAANDQPAWRRLPAWVYIVAWIATSSAVILQVRRIAIPPCSPRWCPNMENRRRSLSHRPRAEQVHSVRPGLPTPCRALQLPYCEEPGQGG